jgi:hypothetical protein
MRIALCLSGQPRTWRSTQASLTAFFAGHELDVFLHTWREGDPAELEALAAAYAPRASRIEARPPFLEAKRRLAELFPVRPVFTMFDMFHSIGASLTLVAPSDAYDLVVRARFDAMFDGTWSGEVPGEGEVIVPDVYPDPTGCTDQLAIGRPAEMMAYGGLGAWLPGALDSLAQGQVAAGRWLRPEPATRHYLETVCGLRILGRPIAMKLCRETQAGLPFAALAEDPLFHAAKHEEWESFAHAEFPELAAQADFDHAGRTPLQLERALTAWLEGRPPKDGFQLLKAPWKTRIKAIDAFIAEQAGTLESLDETSYRGVRMMCAMLLQRMDAREPMTLESFTVHALSANVADMQRAANWAAGSDRLDDLPRLARALGPLTRALSYANPLEQPGAGVWRPR